MPVKTKQKILVIILSIGIEMVISPLRLYGLGFSTLVGFVCYFLFVLLIHRSKKVILSAKDVSLYTAIGILLIQLPLRIFSFTSSLSTLPDLFFHMLGTVTAFMFTRFLRTGKVVVVVLSLSATICMVIFGYPLWYNLMNYDSLNGRTPSKNKVNIVGCQDDGKILETDVLKSDYVMLDYWFTGCKACFDEFPQFQRAYDNPKYKGRVEIMAVNIPIKSDTSNQAFRALEIRDYTFKNIIAKKSHDNLNIKVCPTTIILDKNRQIIFRGGLENAENYLNELLK